MSIEGLIQSPESQIADFFKIQTLLYRHDASLQDYFMPLQLAARASKAHGVPRLSSSQRLRRAAFRVIDSVNRSRSRRKLKADVLFCPLQYFGRKTENRFLIRTVVGLAQTDATILCLMPHSAPCRQELEQELASMGRKGQVDFVDPLGQTNRVDARIFPRVARMRSEAAFQKAVSILEPAGLAPTPETSWGFDHTATFVEAWERLAQDIEFSAVVTRCHWHTLCSSVCRTAQERGKAAVTFQQGTIGHSLDAPVTASRYVAFGRSSATFLSQMNHVFFEACGLPEPPVSYITAGSFYDTIREMPNQFELKTLLMVDEPITHGEFYGVIGQNRAMLKLAEQLLASEVPLRRIVIRPHPFWSDLDFESSRQLIRKYPMRCELSHPSWSLDDDMQRASIAIGVFSGVLTVTSAAGLPTVFIQTDRGFVTGDFDCFTPSQTLLPDAAYREISNLLSDPQAYEHARQLAMRNAREYYNEGQNATLDGSFFRELLATEQAAMKRKEKVQ